MRTAYDILITAPAEQVTRCRLMYQAVIAGQWDDAAHYLHNAASETRSTHPEWSYDAAELAEHCDYLSSQTPIRASTAQSERKHHGNY